MYTNRRIVSKPMRIAQDYLRPVTESDLELILGWRNEPTVRERMFTTHIISWEEHVAWWLNTSQISSNRSLICYIEDVPTGYVGISKIDQVTQSCVLATYLASNDDKYQALQHCMKLEYLALEYAFRNLGVAFVNCEVIQTNSSVIQIHKRFGFTICGSRHIRQRDVESDVEVIAMTVDSVTWDALAARQKRKSRQSEK